MITYLKMVNWRAYEDRAFRFEKGITFLMGANGAGKTSILEAISYALTGEAALFEKGERPQLLRDTSKPALVTLEFSVADVAYQIQRYQTPERAGLASIVRIKDQKTLAENQGSVTKQVEKLLNISDVFLRRIIYMAEGDVFKFLSAPPKDALDTQIRSVLGLTQLDEFSNALTTSEKYFKARLKTLQDLNADLKRLQVRSISELENKLSAGEAAKQNFLNQFEQIGRELGALEQSANIINSFQRELTMLNEAIQKEPKIWQGLTGSSVLSYYDEIQQKVQNAENHHAEIRLHLARLDGQEDAYKRILSLLEPFQENDETVPCPVCRKPLTQSERKNILEEIRQDIANLQREREEETESKNRALQNIQLVDSQLKQLQSIRNMLTHTELPGIHPAQPFEKLLQSVSSLSAGQTGMGRLADLTQQKDTVRTHLDDLEKYQAEYQAVKKRLQDFNYKSPEELDDEIVRIEVRMLSIRSASQATEDTLQNQQNTDMRAIYEQIADLWSSFREEDGWEVENNLEGYPVIINQKEGVKLDLRQLSGGEKTALLIMLHTIIAHHFSKSDFLMVDEPLEHLDPINRRSLIKFLVDAYHHQIFGQAIIATFEESLIRKYQSTEGVNIILV